MFVKSGDTVLVPDPGYPDYWSGVELARANMETMPLTADNQFRLTTAGFPRK